MVIAHPEPDTFREDHVSVDLAQPVVLEVHNPNGDVTIRAADRPDVLIGHVASGRGAARAEVRIDAHGNRIAVHAVPHPGGDWSGGEIDLEAVVGQIARAFRHGGSWAGNGLFGSDNAWCDIVVELPRQSEHRVTVQTASGDIRLEEIAGQITLNTMSGDTRLYRTTGDLVAQSASGDLTLEGTRGGLTARSASGDVRVFAAHCTAVEIKTASGDVYLDAALLGEGPYQAQTASGDVRLTLRQPAAPGTEPAASLAFKTVAGDANVSAPFRQRERRRWQAGPEGARGPHFDVATVAGDLSAEITVEDLAVAAPPAPAAAAAPTPPVSPVANPPVEPAPIVSWPRVVRDKPVAADQRPSEDRVPPGNAARLALLEAVERGEIDIEEALRQLESTDVETRS